MQGSCPLADPEIPPVCLELPETRGVFVSDGVQEIKHEDKRTRCYKAQSDNLIDVQLPLPEQDGEGSPAPTQQYLEPDVPPLYAERSLTGHGQERGGVQTILTNPSDTESVEFVYMESLPWFMRIYLHTLEARVVGAPANKQQEEVIQDTYYRPALDRERGTQLEVKLRIPPQSTVFLTYDFEKSILRYTEYPPDANRGFDVPGAVITILGGASTSNLRTTALLLNLPTPDFSMPYNVIIFTSTAIALAFGGMFNLLVRRFVAADEGPEVTLTRLRNRLKALFRKAKKGKA